MPLTPVIAESPIIMIEAVPFVSGCLTLGGAIGGGIWKAGVALVSYLRERDAVHDKVWQDREEANAEKRKKLMEVIEKNTKAFTLVVDRTDDLLEVARGCPARMNYTHPPRSGVTRRKQLDVIDVGGEDSHDGDDKLPTVK